MDSLKRRNSPKTPKLEKFDAEILPSPYREGEVERSLQRIKPQSQGPSPRASVCAERCDLPASSEPPE